MLQVVKKRGAPGAMERGHAVELREVGAGLGAAHIQTTGGDQNDEEEARLCRRLISNIYI